MQLVLRLQLQIPRRVERGNCGRAFYERPCDDKNTSNFTLRGCGADLGCAPTVYCACLSTPGGRLPGLGAGGHGQRGVAIKARQGQLFGRGKEVLVGMLGRLNPSLKGAKIRLG